MQEILEMLLMNHNPAMVAVHSLPCLHAVVSGSVELLKPDGYDELWLDCSPRGGDIDLLVDGGAGSWARVTVEFANVHSIKCTHCTWKRGPEEIDCCQLLIEVQPPVSIPFETPVSFSELLVVLKKDLKFQELEDGFLKTIYACYYEPNRSISTPWNKTGRGTSLITSSSSRKTTLANATLSSIEKDRSNVTFGSSPSAVNRPVFATASAQNHITTSTPLKNKDMGEIDVKRKKVKKSEESGQLHSHTEDEPVSISIKPRTSVSDRVTLTVHRDIVKTDPCKQTIPNSLRAPLQVDESNVAHSMESNEISFKKTTEEVTHHQTSPSNGHAEVSVNSLESKMAERKTSYEESLINHSTQHTAMEVIDLISPVSEGSGIGVPRMNYGSFLIPEIPPIQSVFGAHHSSLVDFKSLHPPQPVSNSSKLEIHPSSLPFKKKFFGKFRKPLTDVTDSEASLSSCSTKVSKRHFSGIVKVRSPTLNPVVKPSGTRKTGERPMDPFNFVDDNEPGGNENFEDKQDEFRTPTARVRRKRKLFTPGKDDVLHPDDRDSPMNPSNRKSQLPSTSNRRPKRGNCVLDFSMDGSKRKKKTGRKTCVNQKDEENGIRKSLRTRKKVNYKVDSEVESESECDMEPHKLKVEAKLSEASWCRKVEPLRSEGVAMSPPTPSCSAPRLPSDDAECVALSPPRVPVDVAELEPLQISPPPQIDMVVLSSPVKPVIPKKRRKGKNEANSDRPEKKSLQKNPVPCLSNTESVPSTVVSDVVVSETRKTDKFSPPSNMPTFSSVATAETKKVLPTENILRNPIVMGSQALELNDLCDGLHVEADKQSEEKTLTCPAMVPQGMDTPKQIGGTSISVESSSTQIGDSRMHGIIDTICHNIWSQVKTYVNGVKSDNTDAVESIEVNMRTILETQKQVMKTIQDEIMNIARSAANAQSAYEKALASFEVAHDMMKVIESIHRESSVAASVRKNDPRSFSQLRQQIVKLMNETMCSLEK
uniref:Uncharacterized protein n=1 Tax=Lygus hesperus TaxID=30085 RepID=A0A0A9YAB9_LYGHE